MSLRAVPALLGMALAGCGTTTLPVRHPCPSPAPGPQAAAGPVGVSAGEARAHAGLPAPFTLSVTGPARYEAPCAGAVQLLVEDSAGQRVDAVSSAPSPPGTCGDVVLSPGQRQVYDLEWRPDLTLPDGAYTVTLLLGDQPGISVPITLDHAGRRAGGCG